MSSLLVVGLALIAGIGIGYLMFQNLERRKTGGKTAAELKQEHEDYREEVQRHFAKTSDLFQSVTMQYRELYDHLSQGAQNLCETIPPNPSLDLSDKALLSDAAPTRDAQQSQQDNEQPPPPGSETSATQTTGSADEDDVPVAGSDSRSDDEDAIGADAGVNVDRDTASAGAAAQDAQTEVEAKKKREPGDT